MSVLSEGGEREREVLFGRIVELTLCFVAVSEFQSGEVEQHDRGTGALANRR